MAVAKAVTYVENFILSCSFYPLITSQKEIRLRGYSQVCCRQMVTFEASKKSPDVHFRSPHLYFSERHEGAEPILLIAMNNSLICGKLHKGKD